MDRALPASSTSGSPKTAAKICILGSGPAGLITANTLIQDGFTRVTILTRDRSAGGVWAKERVYPGLALNNVHGEYAFSPLPMPQPAQAAETGSRLSGEELTAYMEAFASTLPKDTIRYRVEVLNIAQDASGAGWRVKSQDMETGENVEEVYDKLVLCTGGCSEPSIPTSFSSAAAATVSFQGPVVHSSHFSKKKDVFMEQTSEDSHIALVGGGKSAQDLSSWLVTQGRKNVSVVFEKTDAFLASPIPLPVAIRKSRLLSILSPHMRLRTRLERFLHQTRLGSFLVHSFWKALQWSSFLAFDVPSDSPLRKAPSPFWSLQLNDEGNGKPGRVNFHALVTKNKINLVAPARAEQFGGDGKSVVLSDGRIIRADAVILCTGYTSSWKNIFDDETMEKIGMDRHSPAPQTQNIHDWDSYLSLKSPPPAHPDTEQRMSSIYRGLVPSKAIERRDFAINGAVFSTHNGYTFEVCSHWISSYFLEDKFLRVPTAKQAIEESDRATAWYRKRYPDVLLWANESYSSALPFWSWPQHTDELLDDMGLRSLRSGGNWLTWPFKVIDVSEIATVGAERRAKRKAY